MVIHAPVETTALYGGKAFVHFRPGTHTYRVSVPDLGYENIYQPGVTTILRIKDKSGPLTKWAADQCAVYARQKIAELEAASSTPLEAVPVEQLYTIFNAMTGYYNVIKQKAADVGTIVHAYLHDYLAAVTIGEDEPLRPTLDSAPEGTTHEMLTQANAAISAGLEWFSKYTLHPLRMESPVWSPTYGYIGTGDFIGLVDGELCVVDYKTSKYLYPEVWLQTVAYQRAYEEEFPNRRIEARWGINVGKDGELVGMRRDNSFFADDFGAFLGLQKAWTWERVYEKEQEPITVVGPLEPARAADWIDELQSEALQ